MANPITELFRRNRTVKNEAVTESPAQENEQGNIANLYTSNKTLISGTDVTNSSEAKLVSLYRQMDNDAIISAALDLYADNATQVNQKTGHVVAIESTDKNFQDEINEFLWKIVKIDDEAWQIVRDIARDGKIFLDTKAFNNGREWSFVPVENPALVKALVVGQNEIKYFVVSPEVDEEENTVVSKSFTYMYNKQQDPSGYQVEPKDRFIAGFNTRDIIGKMKVASDSKFNGEEVVEELKIRSGRSILAPAVQTWQTLSALEDALYINRLTKSTEFKIVQVDVSDSNNKQAEQIINAVKNSFKNSESIDQITDRYQNRQSPIPINDFIYVPVKGEKGAVTVTDVGGSVGEININDIDYFRNKLFAGLGVLKAYLGFEETTPGGLGDSTLTKLDERLGRRVLRLQQVLKSVVHSIIHYYWTHSTTARATEAMPDFNIVLGKVSTKEEEENQARLETQINIANSIISLVQQDQFQEFVSNERLFKYIFEDVIGIDTHVFDNQPNKDEISLRVKEIEDRLLTETFDHVNKVRYKEKKHFDESNFITGRIENLMGDEAFTKLDEILNEHSVILEDDFGGKRTLSEVIEFDGFKKAFNELTYAQLKDRSKSKDPARLKKSKNLTAKYTGLDKDNNITFQVTAEDPEANKKAGRPTSYTTKVRLKDLKYLIDTNQEEGRELTDEEITKMALQGDVAVSCSCPAAKWWGQQYKGTQDDYALDKNDIAPTVRIPTQPLCKHTILTLTVLPFWYNTIVRDLRSKGLIEPKGKKVVKNKEVKDDEVKNDEQENEA